MTSKETGWTSEQTSIGSWLSLNRPANMMEIVVGTNVYDPPITAGSLVPNKVCFNVFKPATKSRVWITLAFSSYNKSKRHMFIHIYSWSILKKSTIYGWCQSQFEPKVLRVLHFLLPSGEQEHWGWEPKFQASQGSVGNQGEWHRLDQKRAVIFVKSFMTNKWSNNRI